MSLPIPEMNLPLELAPKHQTPTTARPPVSSDGVRVWNDVAYAIQIGYRPLRLDVYVPEQVVRPPAVIYIHGGAFLFGSRHRDAVSGPVWDELLAAGFAIVAVEYRLSGEAVFPADLHDVTAAIRWVRRYADELGIDATRIATWGESAGGFLATFAGMNLTDVALVGKAGESSVSAEVQAVVAWSPVTNQAAMDAKLATAPMSVQEATPNAVQLGFAVSTDPERAYQSSPIAHVNPGAAPMLILQGTADDLVDVTQGEALLAALRQNGVEAEVHNTEVAPHIFFGIDSSEQRARSIAFLQRVFGQ
ncbi:MAG: alpha/beta hydrolase fold domain-containing protein [Microbacteriaceae bacterium]